ncbi:1378_t:CDS:1 [Ambispora gerdemannii]|uniref:1378_t:CDS:1 n=1 Tax=Ambispora gerdemannii TaxID=144530 RepID=A0A9N8ZVF0_9GLOM|nr:1378_t:CDS:1 [Ambispora gerdemannii]
MLRTVRKIYLRNIDVNASSPSQTPINPKNFIYFTFSGTTQTFQSGYLGITDSTIQGSLHIKSSLLEHPLLTKKILLTLTCTHAAHWSVGETHVRKCLKTLDLAQTLFTSNAHQVLNDCEFPFVFQLPSTAVGSFKTDACKISYQLEAKIYRKGIWYQIFPLKKSTYVPVFWHAFPTVGMYQPITQSNILNSKYQWSFYLSQTHITPNEEINARLNITILKPHVLIKSIEYGLKTYVHAKVHANKFLGKLYATKTKIESLNFINEHNLLIRVPENVISTTNGPFIRVEHKIKVKVVLSGTSNIRIEQPVIVSNAIPAELLHTGNLLLTKN